LKLYLEIQQTFIFFYFFDLYTTQSMGIVIMQ